MLQLPTPSIMRGFLFVPFRCHSRFCPSCGTKYAMERASAISFKLIKYSHRHRVFTIDESLKIFFRRDRSCLNLLFKAVRSVILKMFYKINKSKSFTPGFVAVLHTLGRDLKWNPHIHCIITEEYSATISFLPLRMVKRHCLATAVRVFVKRQRQSRHCLRQDANAGIHGGHLHGRAFRYRLAVCRAAEEKDIVAARCAVLRLVSGFEKPWKDTHLNHSPSKWAKEKHLLI